MKRLVLVLLVVLALSAVSGVGLAAAKGGVSGNKLSAITLDTVSLFAEPSDAGEAVAELPANTIVVVLMADSTGAWLQVEAADGTGYALAESLLVLDPPLLAQKSVVTTSQGVGTGIFADRDFAADVLTTLPEGSVVSVLGQTGQWVYVLMGDGSGGWAIDSPFVPLPAGCAMAMVSISSDNLGVFVEPNITAEIATTIPNGAVVWIYVPEGEFVQVIAPDGVTGYAVTSSFAPLPNTWIAPDPGSSGEAGVFADSDFAADVLGTVPKDAAAVYLESVDDLWFRLYYPGIGEGYSQKSYFGGIYYTAAVQTDSAVVRAGPNDSLYNALAVVPGGAEVTVVGKSANGSWYQVVLPYSEVQYPYYGAIGWMRDFLFVDADGNSTVDGSLLAVTE
jgi:uncharacterized protein YgiM (DUF1202 family)